MQVTGKVVFIGETQVVSEKFSKREFVLETKDQYPQSILIQLSQDKCSLLDNTNLGETLTADINLRGRSWTNPQGEVKYFNTIEAWRLTAVNEVSPTVEEEDPLDFLN